MDDIREHITYLVYTTQQLMLETRDNKINV